MVTNVSTKQTSGQFVPIYLDSLRADAALDFDLYVESQGEMVLFRASSTPFTEETKRALLERNVTRLYVSSREQHEYRLYLEQNLGTIVRDTSIKESARAGIVYDCAKYLMEELFSKPVMGENIRRSQELVESTVGFVLTGRAAFENLLRVMSFDYTTYTHSVNVCALSLALAQFVGIKNPKDLKVLGTGALLHDIGKTRISDGILSKSEPLTSDEFNLIRMHPAWGCDILRDSDLIDREAYHPILQHHERENGSGYPQAIRSQEIHLYGKITAIADVFDAMTTRRAYRSAIEAYPALRTMFDEEGAFDRTLLEQFARMLVPEKP